MKRLIGFALLLFSAALWAQTEEQKLSNPVVNGVLTAPNLSIPVGGLNMTGNAGPSTSIIYQSGTQISGTPTGNLGLIAPIQFIANSDTVNTTTSGINYLSYFYIQDSPLTGHTGGRNALSVLEYINGSPSIAAGPAGYVAGQFSTVVNVNMGGSGSTYLGDIFGADLTATANSGATNLGQLTSLEVSTQIATGASSQSRYGIDIVGGGAVNGVYEDSGLSIRGAAGAAAMTDGILFGGTISMWPLNSGSTMMDAIAESIGGSSSPVALYGIHLNNVVFGACSFSSNDFCVSQNGEVTESYLRQEPLSISAAAWTTNGIQMSVNGAATYTDTTSTGTVPVIAINTIPTGTVAATNSITASRLVTLYVPAPAFGANVAGGAGESIFTTGEIGTTADFSGAGLFISGPTNLSGTITVAPSGAGAASKYACADTSGNLLLQTAAC